MTLYGLDAAMHVTGPECPQNDLRFRWYPLRTVLPPDGGLLSDQTFTTCS